MISPKISIIVPAYNSSTTIERCVKSVINQSFQDWELIIVDNGSTDNTADVMIPLSHCDNRIILLKENNKGVSNARNKGLDAAKGEYICFVDSDDTVEPDYLEQLAGYSKNDLVVCGYYVDTIAEDGYKVKSENYIPNFLEWNTHSSKDCLYATFANGFIHICCNKLFKRSIIEIFDLRFEPYPVNEDYIFIMNYLLHSNSICVLNKPLYHWIRVVNTATGVNSIPKNLLSIYNESHELTREFFEDNDIADNIAFYSYEMMVYKFYAAHTAGHISKAQMYARLEELCSNPMVKDSIRAYPPVSACTRLLTALLFGGHYKLHYLITQKMFKIFCL